MKGGSLWSRPVWYVTRKNRKKLFWFSSLDQIVHFDAIIFCRTFVELFWSVRVDRKKRVTIIVSFHFMKRRLKTQLCYNPSSESCKSCIDDLYLNKTLAKHRDIFRQKLNASARVRTNDLVSAR